MQTDRTEWMESRTSRIEALIREWLADPDVVLVCGRWSAGVIAEIFPAGTGVLTPQGYDGRFAGVRDLTIPGTRHHLHLDLGKFRGALFLVAPSVCFGFRPSFEVWFDTAERDAIDLAGRPSSDFGFAIARKCCATSSASSTSSGVSPTWSTSNSVAVHARRPRCGARSATACGA